MAFIQEKAPSELNTLITVSTTEIPSTSYPILNHTNIIDPLRKNNLLEDINKIQINRWDSVHLSSRPVTQT